MGWGSGIRGKKLILDPDPGVKKSPDPGSESATLVKPHHECKKNYHFCSQTPASSLDLDNVK
jgi:hypothetical protein